MEIVGDGLIACYWKFGSKSDFKNGIQGVYDFIDSLVGLWTTYVGYFKSETPNPPQKNGATGLQSSNFG